MAVSKKQWIDPAWHIAAYEKYLVFFKMGFQHSDSLTVSELYKVISMYTYLILLWGHALYH